MIEILAIVESEDDFRTASCLADRVLAEKSAEQGSDWIGEKLDELRKWVGFQPTMSFSCWKDIKVLWTQRQGRSGKIRSFLERRLRFDKTERGFKGVYPLQDNRAQHSLVSLLAS